MTQSKLNREVTQAIDKTASTIRRMGFPLDGVSSHLQDADSIELGPTSSTGMPALSSDRSLLVEVAS